MVNVENTKMKFASILLFQSVKKARAQKRGVYSLDKKHAPGRRFSFILHFYWGKGAFTPRKSASSRNPLTCFLLFIEYLNFLYYPAASFPQELEGGGGGRFFTHNLHILNS